MPARYCRAAGESHAGGRARAIVSSSPENFAYVTGYPSPTQSLMRWRHAMALVTANTEASLLVGRHGSEHHRSKQPQVDIAVWREFAFDAMKVLADLLQRRGLAGARIGHRTRSPAGSRFCRTEKPGAVGTLRGGAGAAGATAPDQDRRRDRPSAQAVANSGSLHCRA